MGYAYYEIDGKPCGYGVEAKCEEPGCDADIDRGLAYLCGRTPGGDEHGCGGYFCGKHLYANQQCQRCHDQACDSCLEPADELVEIEGAKLCETCREAAA